MSKYYEYHDTDSVNIELSARGAGKSYAAKQALNSVYGIMASPDIDAISEKRLCKLETHRTDFEPYLQRVLNEAKELHAKICKLRKYLLTKAKPDNPEFARAETREEAFERQQLVFMEGYLEMLLCRMEMWC